jgi:serine/threonine protein kinase
MFEDYSLSDTASSDGNFKAELLGSDEKFDIKIIPKFGLWKARKISKLSEQIKIMRKIDHINIVQLHRVYEDRDAVYLVKESVEG